MQISSSVFNPGEMIPSKYTCDGLDITPPLIWKEIPPGVKSMALIMDDPDAPAGTWVHWVIFNIPAVSGGLKENFPRESAMADGTLQGSNSWGQIGYGGPCPPSGAHRYFFRLFALDCILELDAGARKDELFKVMSGHILQEAQMFGKYQRLR